MTEPTTALEITNLTRKYRKFDAVNNLSLTVQKGTCYGFFGPNGAGKTTTIKCIMNHLRPTSGQIRVFGIDPQQNEVEVKSHIGYVPEYAAFYPWMTIRKVLDYSASFYPTWNRELEADLLQRLNLDETKKISETSKGMKVKLSLICAISPDPDLLLLDEPTTGLDPLVRKELIETVIGAYQDRNPENHTIFVSTHMLQEFEGLIDDFTMLNEGNTCLSLSADQAREQFRKIHMRFTDTPPTIQEDSIYQYNQLGREVELTTSNYSKDLSDRLQALSPEFYEEDYLSLEEIFIVMAKEGRESQLQD
jgi:ABC-2 type transport system ATP-binding protein